MHSNVDLKNKSKKAINVELQYLYVIKNDPYSQA